jgi:ribosome-interacting GTPase 1
MKYEDVDIQLIEIPAINSRYYDRGLVNNADVLLIFIERLEDIEEINKLIEKAPGEKIFVFTKSDKLNENEKRKISANLSTKKYNFVIISSYTNEGIEELKKKMFQSFKKIRIYTKQPEDKERSLKPMILKPEISVKDVAEKIFKGFSKKIKETRIWGPSSDYPGQVVGLNHKLKDLDTVEFKTK